MIRYIRHFLNGWMKYPSFVAWVNSRKPEVRELMLEGKPLPSRFRFALTNANEYAILNKREVMLFLKKYGKDGYVSDIIDIISDKSIPTLFAHREKLSKEQAAREVFANLASLRARNTASYDAIVGFFPELTSAFELIFGGE